MKEKSIKSIIKILYYAIPMGLFFVYLQTVFNNSIWLDEAFSMSMIKQNLGEIIYNTSIDVHPPLYYIILKIGVCIFQVFLGNSIWAAKLVSSIPILLLLIASNTTIKKLFGKRTSFLFQIFLLGMPQIMNYAIEIRMYTWGLFFVTMFYLYGIKWKKSNKKIDLVVMTVFALLSGYTHYFALVSVICIYLYMLIDTIMNKNKMEIKRIIISIAISCILYLPWLIVWIKQVMTVKESYWIGEITLSIFFSYFELPYAVEENKIFTYILAGVLLIAVLLLWKKRKEKESRYCLWGLLAPIGTILIGVIASLSLRPIFIGRYIVCSLGCLWLAVAILLGKGSNKKQSYLGESLLITVLLIITIGNEISLVKKEREYEQEIDKTLSYINTISENILLFDGNQIQRVIAYYYPSTETYVYNKEIAELTKLVYRQTNMRIIEQLEEIQKMDKTVDVFTIENTILGELRDKGYEYKKCGTYHIEHYEFSIYEIINKRGE